MDKNSLRIHFIAIGGSLMHNMAIALQQSGHVISGSDDEIFEPSRSRLESHGLLPADEGWAPEKLDENIDAVILGMHAKKDNPELLKAQSLGLKIYSFPEFIYEQSKNKQRIVIAGSHGKTSISAMVLHVLRYFNRSFDYAIGAQLEGFDTMVQFSDAPIIIIEGDEYLSSPLDPSPKFLKYQHHIGLISGIAWDHINVFSSEQTYHDQFKALADATPKAGTLIYFEGDAMAKSIGSAEKEGCNLVPYNAHPHKIEQGITYLLDGKEMVPLKVFGAHNMQNISGALEILKKIGISTEQFYEAIQTFEGADRRLQNLASKAGGHFFSDFAHAPSKVNATAEAVKAQYPDNELVACLELHTYSSLNKAFLPHYKGSLSVAQYPVVYYNPATLAHKQLPKLSSEDITQAFDQEGLMVFDDSQKLKAFLKSMDWKNKDLLMMSSGNFDGINIASLAEELFH